MSDAAPTLLAFTGLATLLALSPGVDMALVTRHALSGGRRAALLTIVGICLGCTAHATAAAIGVSAILTRSASAFEVVKLAGAAYLILLGLLALRDGARTGKGGSPEAREPVPNEQRGYFVDGLVTNLLNPKVALFYLSALPQFVPKGSSMFWWSLLLGGIHISIGAVWLVAYASFLNRFTATFERMRNGLVLATGVILTGLGARLLLERR